MPVQEVTPQEPAVIAAYSFDEFVEAAKLFHGYAAPGLLIGGFMVDAARKQLPEDILFDAVSETAWCLPDAVQMLTPCTVGNGWLKVVPLGIFAVTLYDKYTGKGFRVALDLAKAEPYPEIRTWLLKSKPKREQDSDKLREEIRQAGSAITTIMPVTVRRDRVQRASKGQIALCPTCGAAYPASHGRICRLCQGEGPYMESMRTIPGAINETRPELRAIPVDEAVGRTVLHDMTRIVPGKSKGVAFYRGQTLEAGDVCRLHQLGKYHVYVEDRLAPETGDWVHEDAAASAFASAMAGPGVHVAEGPKEGKVTLAASEDGFFQVDRAALEAFNMLPDVMAACRHPNRMMTKGTPLAATRAIPLYLAKHTFEQAMRLLEAGPLFSVASQRITRVGILVTGTEIANGLIQDKFAPIVSSKVAQYGCEVVETIIAPDDCLAIRQGVERLLAAGTELLVTTAGLSVDPDDVTRKGLLEAGATDMLHGAPLLPGAMTLSARIGPVRVLGVPACALFFKTTSFDVLLPTVLADLELSRKDLARLAVGGMCMECKTCTYPKCRFGG